MQSRFSVYMDMLESKGLGVMKRASRNKFSYKIHEATTFDKQEDIAKDGGFRDQNGGAASAKIAAIEAKAKERKNPATATQQATPVQPTVAGDPEAEALAQDPYHIDHPNANQNAGTQDEGGLKASVTNARKEMDAAARNAAAAPVAPAPVAPAPVAPAPVAPAPVEPAPVEPTPVAPTPVAPAPAAPEAEQPGRMSKFLSGVNKAGEKLGNFQDRAKAFSQRTGGQGQPGDLSKLMKYGMFGQESLDKPAQIENLKQQFIQQGYPEAEAVKMATNTVNQAPVDNQRQRGRKEQLDTLKQMYINNGWSEEEAEKMASSEQAKRGTPQDQQGVTTTGSQQSGVNVGDDQQTGVQTNTPTKTNDVLDQATIDTIDPNQIEQLIKTTPDDELDSAVQAVADGSKVDAVALRQFIDAQREAISKPPPQ